MVVLGIVLAQVFGGRFSGLSITGPPAVFDLRGARSGQPGAERTVLVGNAAQSLHPVAGQGLNLGVRDACTLAELCADCNGVPYHGRAAVYEMFEMTDTMREVIAGEECSAAAIRKQMQQEKQTMLQRDALRLVVDGTTSLEEVKRAFAAPGGGRKKKRPVKRRPRPE